RPLRFRPTHKERSPVGGLALIWTGVDKSSRGPPSGAQRSPVRNILTPASPSAITLQAYPQGEEPCRGTIEKRDVERWEARQEELDA
ncbi:MAG: hypothetical protein NWR72_15520, partial [Bacteroidia bacterium]|nr:hypothetical protein [Bacteroidia bacterium]